MDLQEVRNAIDQALKEMHTRFDLKDSKSRHRLEGNEAILLPSADEYKLKAVNEILQQKLVKRGVSLKALTYGKLSRLPAHRAPEDHPAAGHPDREGQGDREAGQGLEEEGAGLHPGRLWCA